MFLNIFLILFAIGLFWFITKQDEGFFGILVIYAAFFYVFVIFPPFALLINVAFYFFTATTVYLYFVFFYLAVWLLFFIIMHFENNNPIEHHKYKKFIRTVEKLGVPVEKINYIYFHKNAGNQILLNDSISKEDIKTVKDSLSESGYSEVSHFYLKNKPFNGE